MWGTQIGVGQMWATPRPPHDDGTVMNGAPGSSLRMTGGGDASNFDALVLGDELPV